MTRTQANLLLILIAMIWGSTFVVQQVSTGDLGAIMFSSTRFLIGALVVLPLAYAQLKRRQQAGYSITWNHVIIMIVTGCVLLSAAVLQQVGIFFTSVANAGFLTALYVPLVPFFARVILKIPVHWSTWPAAIACLFGTYAMSGAQSFHLCSGDIWVICSAIFWAIHVLLIGHIAIKTQAPLVVAFVQFLTAGIAGLPVGIIIEHPILQDFSGALFGIFYVGCLSVGAGFTLQVVAQRFTAATDCAIILSAETVFAALSAFIFLGDRLSPHQLLGAALILGGILAVQLFPLLISRRKIHPSSR